jgi:hypothetical protein
MKTKQTWNAADVYALGVRTDLVTACKIVLDVGRNRAWELYNAGELPFPTLRFGRKVVVPVAPLIKLLGLPESEFAESAARSSAA